MWRTLSVYGDPVMFGRSVQRCFGPALVTVGHHRWFCVKGWGRTVSMVSVGASGAPWA